MEFVVITGVSTGIGYAIAETFLWNGYTVFGTVRKETDGKKLVEKFKKPGFIPVELDVTQPEQIKQAYLMIRKRIGDGTLTGLINNAGIAVTGPLTDIPREQFKKQFEVNVLGLMEMVKTFLPILKSTNSTNQPGRIINIGSIAGKVVLPFSGAYAASKHALEALSHALRRELKLFEIKVITIRPGPVKTPIWNKALGESHRYYESEYSAMIKSREKNVRKTIRDAIPPTKVASVVLKAMKSKNPKTAYVVTGEKLKNWYLPTTLPPAWFDRILWKFLGV